ncbi:MAG: DUF2975 domain-containing protein [Lachnospiraceae bacterium]|nr:DUF2975 domain-containing protein [Lachnospiraceae bacterium]
MTNRIRKMGNNKQYQLSLCLKVVDIIMMCLVVGLFGVFSWYEKTGVDQMADNIRAYGYFIYLTEALTLLMLAIFWRVATEIGRDNSFSMENVKHFRYIGFCSGLISIGYIIRMIYVIVSGQMNVFRIVYCLMLAVLGILVLSICLILSCLIRNAYLMKQENDLTI